MRDARTFALALALFLPPTVLAQTKSVDVPFVGCKSDGQVGPLDAPTGKIKAISIPSKMARSLSYYEAKEGAGVLAPRNWYCFGTYGSNGSTLYVSPVPLHAGELLSENWKGFSGPAIQLSVSIGGTSGRFEVAQVIARVFPAHRAYVRKVLSEGLEPANSFPYCPYANDQLLYTSKEIVEYLTPAETEGLGTRSRLQKSDAPIQGVAILTRGGSDLIHLAVRLPSQMSDLVPAIIRHAERQ